MSYATPADYATRWGSEGLPQRQNEEGELVQDDGRMEAVLADASHFVDASLQKRFQTPFDPVPPLITALVLDVARFRLAADVLESSSPAKMLYQEAMTTLECLASGRMEMDAPLLEGSIDGGKEAFFESKPPKYNLDRI